MSFWADFDDILEASAPLAPLTTFGIGGPAEHLARPRTLSELGRMLTCADQEGIPVRLLGAGSNLLVADEGVGGLVVKLAGREFSRLEMLPGAVSCGAGLSLGRLVREAAEAGLSGLEGLAGIPASVGGALRMNAGGRYGSIGAVTREVRCTDGEGNEVALKRDEVDFGYRQSSLAGLVVTGCTLELTPEAPETVRKRTREVIEEKKRMQPLGEKSAGCVFRNPRADLPAGRLLDDLGFKGARAGGAEVSGVHANYIVNTGAASCADVLELVDRMREGARREKGVDLELELEIWS